MDRGAGLWSLLSSSWICLRMLKAMLRWKAWTWMLSTFHTSKLTKPKNRGAAHTVLMEESTLTCHRLATLSWFYLKRRSQSKKSPSHNWQLANPERLELVVNDQIILVGQVLRKLCTSYPLFLFEDEFSYLLSIFEDYCIHRIPWLRYFIFA